MTTKDNDDVFDQSMTEDTVELANKIRLNLGIIWEISESDEHVDRLPVNLADVYMICRKSESLIEELRSASVWENSEELRRVVREIQSELFIHLEYHYESLRTGLEAITERILPPETEEELMDSIESRVNKALGRFDRS